MLWPWTACEEPSYGMGLRFPITFTPPPINRLCGTKSLMYCLNRHLKYKQRYVKNLRLSLKFGQVSRDFTSFPYIIILNMGLRQKFQKILSLFLPQRLLAQKKSDRPFATSLMT